MTPDEYRKAAQRTEYTPDFIRHSSGDSPRSAEQIAHDLFLARSMHALLGMMSELGELADAFKKHFIYGKPLDYVNLVEELGDGDWYRALIANALDIGFEAAWEKNIAKLRARYPDKFTSEQALHRDLDAERRALEAPTLEMATLENG